MIIIILIVSFIFIVLFMGSTTIKPTVNGRFIHSSLHNRSFYIENYTDEMVSEIQKSLNRRDNQYKIIFKDKYYLLKNKEIINIIESC